MSLWQILTKDSVTTAVDAVCYYRICDPVKSVNSVKNAYRSTQLLAQTTLRNHLGLRTLSEILSERDEISHQIQHSLDEATEPWGVKVRLIGNWKGFCNIGWVKRGIKLFFSILYLLW